MLCSVDVCEEDFNLVCITVTALLVLLSAIISLHYIEFVCGNNAVLYCTGASWGPA